MTNVLERITIDRDATAAARRTGFGGELAAVASLATGLADGSEGAADLRNDTSAGVPAAVAGVEAAADSGTTRTTSVTGGVAATGGVGQAVAARTPGQPAPARRP